MKLSLTFLLLLLVSTFCIYPVFSLYCGQENCYELLEIKRNATKAQVRKAFRRLSSEVHPDKHPNDEKALEKFRKLNGAYEALIDDSKRVKYNDFLDNPIKYYDYIMQNSKEVYAPKTNTIFVVVFLLGIANLLHWLNMNYNYKSTIEKLKESQEYKRQVTKLMKSKQAKTKQDAEKLIDLDIVGLNKPHWKNLFFFQLIKVPKWLFNKFMVNAKWFVNYRIRKQEYTEEDKLYLIMKNLSLDQGDMEKLSQKMKEDYLKKELWDTEKCEEFLRLKRIEDNRLGKTKKKKKHNPIPYSETEEVSME